jgi:thymidylate synthase
MRNNNFRWQYEGLLGKLLSTTCPAARETNARTGEVIRALDPFSFSLDLSDGKLPVCGVRKTFPRSAAAEVAWFLLGTKSSEFIRRYAPFWDKFLEEDGDTVAGAYGYRWRHHFGRDQIADAIATLQHDPTNRRVWISAWDPAQDGLGRPSKNVPCPVGFTLSISEGRLNSALMIRSSDVFVGLPYDVMGHALLMAAAAQSLGSALGRMHVTLAHPHLYEKHLDMAFEALRGQPSDDTIYLPVWDVDEITQEPEMYVEAVAKMAKKIAQPSFACKPEVIV